MIQKRPIYYSTETGKYYPTYDKAVKAENDEIIANATQVIKLFNENYEAFKSEIDKIHEKYDPVLDSLMERIHKLGIEISETGDTDNRKIKVRVRKLS
ncbi:MAG: hypothetical protein NC320_03020 [Clostridium sp.]|nr:hypothetical protein [Clostridium sp.]